MGKLWTDEQKAEAKRKYAERIAMQDTYHEFKDETPKELNEVVASAPVQEVDTAIGMAMGYEHKIQSMTNAIKILPPNMIKDGRHLKGNIQAICGFMVLDEMMDEVYKDYVHPDYK